MAVIDIIAQRGSGDKEGEVIQDPFLGTINAALARGRHEINNQTARDGITLVAGYQAGVNKGSIVKVIDALQGPMYYARVTAISHGIDGVLPIMQLTLERPHD